jgi:hypothetical protein
MPVAGRQVLRPTTARPITVSLGLVLMLPGAVPTCAEPLSNGWAATVYGARISSETGWEDILLNPLGAEFVDAYLIAAALSRRYASYQDAALALEAEGQVVYNFGEQHHWEFNVVPVVARWQRFPWSDRVDTSIAFGLGLSYATEKPAVEVEIEGDTEQLLIYWVLEGTLGPVDAPWALSLRLHHRSVAWGLMGNDGGMNAVGLGVRYEFGRRSRPGTAR